MKIREAGRPHDDNPGGPVARVMTGRWPSGTSASAARPTGRPGRDAKVPVNLVMTRGRGPVDPVMKCR